MKVKRTERGWAGHYILSNRCLFRRNTLLEYKNIKIVVSSVGLRQGGESHEKGYFEPVGLDHYFETLAFHANQYDLRYKDADVSKQISFESNNRIYEVDADDLANVMHENAVEEITDKLLMGETFPPIGA